jgi:hypothetical protein
VRFRFIPVLAAAIILWICFAPLSAHHSISAEFDLEKRVTVAGTVTKVEWMNPHTYFFLDAPNPKTRKVENWAFQLNNPKALRVLGWNQETLKVGHVVTASGSPSLSGSKAVFTREIRFQDGRKIFAEVPLPASTP